MVLTPRARVTCTIYREPLVTLITRSRAEAILAPYHAPFSESITCAFANWREFGAPNQPLFRQRTLANYVQDRVDVELRTRLGANENVTMSKPRRDRFWMLIKGGGDMALVRIKKLNPDFTTSNYRTKAAIRFDQQQELDSIPSAPRITLGYRLNRGATAMVGLWVVFLQGNEVLWKYELVDGPEGTATHSEPTLPFAPTAGVRLKSAVEKKSRVR